jgi:spore coat polysaccharide biosynthesis predicted glycosyltransferase SpsG
MSARTYSVLITTYEYGVLSANSLIASACSSQLKSAIKHDDDEEVELVMTLSALQDLIGFVAAEANHARSKRLSQALNALCDHLEAAEGDIKRGF